MRASASAGVAAIGLLLRGPMQPPAVLMTVQLADQWRSTSATSASVSADGRYVAVTSYARLVPADTDDRADIYVLDRLTGRVTLESLPVDGRPLIGDSGHPRLSGDGRYLVFHTVFARDPGAPAVTDIVFRDRVRDTSTRICGEEEIGATRWNGDPGISEDGRVVVFRSTATDLVPGRDENGIRDDIYLLDTGTRTMRRVSVDSRGIQSAVGSSFSPSLSGDGRFVAFASTADLDDKPAGDPVRREQNDVKPQVYVRDDRLGTTRRVSAGARGSLDGASFDPAISRDGRFIAFVSDATNLTENDRNRSSDVFLRDMQDGSVVLVSRGARGATANGPSTATAISADGQFIAFQSEASDLICPHRCEPPLDDINLLFDVFRFDRLTGRSEWISALPSGGWAEESGTPQLDGSGQIVAFTSRHPIDERDVRNDFDLFIHMPASSTPTARDEPRVIR
jgi:Tol biopolymer transport system component